MAQEGISFADIPFADRADAGRRLARVIEAHLTEKADFADPLVMALPRGGVPVAFEVARTLGVSLELLIVRKIGAPGHPEFGLGALVDSDEPPLGAGEAAQGPTAAALANAVHAALGVRVRDLPLNAESVIRATDNEE